VKEKSLRGLGGFLLLASCIVAFLWFYWLAPVRHIPDFQWWEMHSEKAQWKEVQTRIHRVGWFHDDSGPVGWWGDKNWAAWIINHIEAGQNLWDYGHKDSALALITNQEVGRRADDWLTWWKNNQSLSQEEWIREGFKQKGAMLQEPLSKRNIEGLLMFIGQYRYGQTNPVTRATDYNAKRWLRDSDFDPREFKLADLATQNGDEVLLGLIKYSGWVAQHPKTRAVGVLPIGKPVEDEGAGVMIVWINSASVQQTVMASIGGLFAMGAFCFYLAHRIRRHGGG
jgi:hypothetical protein